MAAFTPDRTPNGTKHTAFGAFRARSVVAISSTPTFSTGWSVLGTSPVRSSEKFALRVGLLLDQRFRWLSRSYGICVPMHYLPGALFGSKDHRDPQGERCYFFTSADLGLRPLYLHHVGKLRSYVLLYDLGANELAVSDLRCSMLPSLSNLIPSMRWRAKGISEADVFPTRP